MDLFINGHNVNEISEVQYIMVLMERNVWGTKVKVSFDIGLGAAQESKITDRSGDEIALVSEIDYMNYLYKTGWKFLNQTLVTGTNGMPVLKYLFERIV